MQLQNTAVKTQSLSIVSDLSMSVLQGGNEDSLENVSFVRNYKTQL